MSLIRGFLADRLGFILTYFAGTGLVLALVGLLYSYRTADAGTLLENLAYAALLTATVLAVGLSLEYMRWAPFARQVRTLAEGAGGLESLANLPPGATREQAEFRELLGRLYSLSVAERGLYQEAHQRHLAFMNLWVHQMKTPVSAISLIAQRTADKSPESLPAAMEQVEEESARLAEGLEMVLNMARLQDFALDYKIERGDLLEMARQAVNSRKRQFIRLGIYPEVQAADGDWSVLTDLKWNRFVIDQVLSNALKYGFQGGRPGQRITLRLERSGKEVRLHIADQGPGIVPEDLPRVFEPFFTGVNGRRYADATGIGLYLVRIVTERLGHRVQIASEVGRGTAVTIVYNPELTEL